MNLLLNDFKGRLGIFRAGNRRQVPLARMEGETFHYSFGKGTVWGAVDPRGTMQQ